MAHGRAGDLRVDPAAGSRGPRDAAASTLLPSRSWPSFFPKAVAKLQWDAAAIALAPDAAAWPGLDGARRARLTALLAGFRVAEDAVAEHLVPFGAAVGDPEVAAVLALQRRDEQRHAVMFDRIVAEVLGLAGGTPDARRDAARAHAPAGVLELFEARLPAVAGELAAGRGDVGAGIGLYHMILEGVVLLSGQRALLADLDADGALPGVREAIDRVQRDERWHIGFGLRCLIDLAPSPAVVKDVLAAAEEAAGAWGDAVPPAITAAVVPMCRRRLAVAKLLPTGTGTGATAA